MVASSAPDSAGAAAAEMASSTCAGRLAPISTEQTAGRCSSQRKAMPASGWPRAAAMVCSAHGPPQARLVQHVGAQEAARARGARVGGNATVQVAVGQQALGQRRERDAADAFVDQGVEQAALRTAVQQVVARLVDDAGRAELAQQRGGTAQQRRRVIGQADVERATAAHRMVERRHGLLERCVGVGPVVIEQIDMVELQPAQALVQAGQQVFAAAAIAMRVGTHHIAGLGADDQLVAQAGQLVAQHASQQGLGGPRRRTVVVGQVEVDHPPVDGPAQHRAGLRLVVGGAEVVPQTQRDAAQAQAAAPDRRVCLPREAVGGRLPDGRADSALRLAHGTRGASGGHGASACQASGMAMTAMFMARPSADSSALWIWIFRPSGLKLGCGWSRALSL
jgi:hypothetical protein